jgi:hypothetical protein
MARPKSIEGDVNAVGEKIDLLVASIGVSGSDQGTVEEIFRYLEARLGSAKRKAIAKAEVPDTFKLGMSLPNPYGITKDTQSSEALAKYLEYKRTIPKPEEENVPIAGTRPAAKAYVAPDTDEVDFIEE